MIVAGDEGRLKVVLDTNVYFSAFISPRGTPFQVWKKAVERKYVLLISPLLRVFRGIAIVRPADFLRTLGDG